MLVRLTMLLLAGTVAMSVPWTPSVRPRDLMVYVSPKVAPEELLATYSAAAVWEAEVPVHFKVLSKPCPKNGPARDEICIFSEEPEQLEKGCNCGPVLAYTIMNRTSSKHGAKIYLPIDPEYMFPWEARVLTHELGHAQGLEHSTIKPDIYHDPQDSIMFPQMKDASAIPTTGDITQWWDEHL